MPVKDAHAYVPPSVLRTTTASNVDVLARPTCDGNVFDGLHDIDVVSTAVCAAILLLGLLYAFFGYRIHRFVLFTVGMVYGAGVIGIVCEKENVSPKPYINYLIGLGGGVLFGLVTMLVEYCGRFLAGFVTGAAIGVTVVVVVDLTTDVDNIWATIGILFVLGLVFAVVTLTWCRQSMIMQTSFMGAVLCMLAIDHVVQDGVIRHWTWATLNMKHPPLDTVCWYSWIVTSLVPSIAILAYIVQINITSRNYHHKGPSSGSNWQYHGRRPTDSHLPRVSVESEADGGSAEQRRRRRHQRIVISRQAPTNQQLPAEMRSPPALQSSSQNYKRKSFRSLYRQRCKHGDIICQNAMDRIESSRYNSLENPPEYTMLTNMSLTRAANGED